MADFLSPAKTSQMVDTDELGVALHEAAVRGEKRKLKKLLKKGARVSRLTLDSDKGGSFLIYHSAVFPLYILMYSAGISVDYPNSTGQTALFCACFEAQEGIVDTLLKHGANPNE